MRSDLKETTPLPVDNATLERLMRENTDLTKSMHRILVGEPEYGREGLVKKVDFHDKIVTKGGAIFGAFYVAWEGYKFYSSFHH